MNMQPKYTSGLPSELEGFKFVPMEEDNGNPVQVPEEFGVCERGRDNFSHVYGDSSAQWDIIREGESETPKLQVSNDGEERSAEGAPGNRQMGSSVLIPVGSEEESGPTVCAGSPCSGKLRQYWTGTVIEQSAFSRFLIGLAFSLDRILQDGREPHPEYQDHLDLEHDWLRRLRG